MVIRVEKSHAVYDYFAVGSFLVYRVYCTHWWWIDPYSVGSGTLPVCIQSSDGPRGARLVV